MAAQRTSAFANDPEDVAHIPQQRLNARADHRLVGEFLAEVRRRQIERLAAVDPCPCRHPASILGQQLYQGAGDRLGGGQRGLRPIALGARDAGLPQRECRTRQYRNQRQAREARRQRMPAQEAARAIAPGAATGLHRLQRQVALKIIGERLDAGGQRCSGSLRRALACAAYSIEEMD